MFLLFEICLELSVDMFQMIEFVPTCKVDLNNDEVLALSIILI